MQETRFWSHGQEDPLEEDKATHSSILAWEIPWTEEIGGLQTMRSQRIGHDLATEHTARLVADPKNSTLVAQSTLINLTSPNPRRPWAKPHRLPWCLRKPGTGTVKELAQGYSRVGVSPDSIPRPLPGQSPARTVSYPELRATDREPHCPTLSTSVCYWGAPGHLST